MIATRAVVEDLSFVDGAVDIVVVQSGWWVEGSVGSLGLGRLALIIVGDFRLRAFWAQLPFMLAWQWHCGVVVG